MTSLSAPSLSTACALSSHRMRHSPPRRTTGPSPSTRDTNPTSSLARHKLIATAGSMPFKMSLTTPRSSRPPPRSSSMNSSSPAHQKLRPSTPPTRASRLPPNLCVHRSCLSHTVRRTLLLAAERTAHFRTKPSRSQPHCCPSWSQARALRPATVTQLTPLT